MNYIVAPGLETTTQLIIIRVCHLYNIGIDEISMISRTRRIVEPRQMAMYLIRNKTELGLSAIGKMFNKDHATVLNAMKLIENQIDIKSETGNIAEKLMEEL